jgi:hypothetical protein
VSLTQPPKEFRRKLLLRFCQAYVAAFQSDALTTEWQKEIAIKSAMFIDHKLMTMLDRFFQNITDNQIRRNTIRCVPELIRAIEIHMDCQGIRHSAESHSRTPLARS